MAAVRHRAVAFPRSAAFAAVLAAAMLGGAPPAASSDTAPSFDEEASKVAVPAGASVGVTASAHFDNAGTNPRLTDMTFSTTEYYGSNMPGIVDGVGYFRVKSAEELNALSKPPDSPFMVDVDLTMENDEGQTASGTLKLETSYEREEASVIPTPPPPVDPPPKPTDISENASPGKKVSVDVDEAFDNAGTNPKFTAAVFSKTVWYEDAGFDGDSVWATVRTSAELSAMTPPPSDPFTVFVDVTMENDEAETATGKVMFVTTYGGG